VHDSVCGDEHVFDRPVSAAAPRVRTIPAEETEDPEDPLVLAVEVYNPTEAELVCALLTAHDIPCLLQAENPYAVDATYTLGPLARRRIMVRQSDLPHAQDILAAHPEPETSDE